MGATSVLEINERLRQALLDAELRNKELLDNSLYGVFRASLEGSFLSGSPALLHMLACSSVRDLQTLSLATDVFRFPEQYSKLLASCRESGLVHGVSTEWRRKDGSLLAVKLHLRYVQVPDGRDQIEGLVEDVTELRILEQQLLSAQKYEAVGQVAGGIAHDFNNVVGAIMAWAELGLEETRSLPAISARFSRIREQASRAAALTRELLALTQCQEAQARPPQPNSVIRNVMSFLAEGIGRPLRRRFNRVAF
jgi:signal transduction histidine kinase